VLAGLATLPAVAVGGCSGNGAALPSLPELTGTFTEATIVGSPTEVYERIARGALSCWFGASGPLKAGFVYHAEADPPGKGGKAEISIHERNRLSDSPKGMRAYRITIAAESEKTNLAFENIKMPEPLAVAMEADARRWGTGVIGCAEAPSGGWSENAPPPPSPPAEGKKRRAPKHN
jgi:hypothetical protein